MATTGFGDNRGVVGNDDPRREEMRRDEARRDMRRDDRDRSVRLVTATETRRSFLTTEFWAMVIAVAALLVAGYWDDAHVRINLAWTLATGVVAAYLLSRGLAKAGSGNPEIRDLD